MSDYISRKALIDEINCEYDLDYGEILINPVQFADMVEDQPIADVVEVLRCKDCEYWGDEDGFQKTPDGVLAGRCVVHNYIIDGRHTGWCPTENDYCSYGERK